MKDRKMEEQLNNLFKIKKTDYDVDIMHPLVLAYIGDAVYEMYIRLNLVEKSKSKPHKLHIDAIEYVSAKSQSKILDKIEEILTDEEKEIVRKGRNAKQFHNAKNASTYEYSRSTAFECLVGYLFLKNRYSRLEEILKDLI